MSALGDMLLGPSFPGSDRDRAEGYRHLANQLGGWLDHAVGSTDPRHPLLFRHNDLVMRWGGPNVDQNARRATIDGSGTYRLTGILHACEDFVLQVKGGEMHTGGSVIVGEITGSDIGVGPGDQVEILLSPHEQSGHWLRTDERVDTVHLREYYFDWQAAEPATFVIERLDTLDEPTLPLTPERVAGMLERAASTIEQSIVLLAGLPGDAAGGGNAQRVQRAGRGRRGCAGLALRACLRTSRLRRGTDLRGRSAAGAGVGCAAVQPRLVRVDRLPAPVDQPQSPARGPVLGRSGPIRRGR